MRTYRYFICKTSWCISITIKARIISMPLHEENLCDKVCEHIWLRFMNPPLMKDWDFYSEDKEYLIKGLKMIKTQIIECSKYDDTLFEIGSLEYSLCDFQPEGLVMAIMGWASEEFGFLLPSVDISYDRDKNKYIFNFENFNI